MLIKLNINVVIKWIVQVLYITVTVKDFCLAGHNGGEKEEEKSWHLISSFFKFLLDLRLIRSLASYKFLITTIIKNIFFKMTIIYGIMKILLKIHNYF